MWFITIYMIHFAQVNSYYYKLSIYQLYNNYQFNVYYYKLSIYQLYDNYKFNLYYYKLSIYYSLLELKNRRILISITDDMHNRGEFQRHY